MGKANRPIPAFTTMKFARHVYGSFTSMTIKVRRSWHQRFARQMLRFIEWRIRRMERTLEKVRAKMDRVTNERLFNIHLEYVEDLRDRIVSAKQILREGQHRYVNTYITPFGKRNE